MKRKMIYAAISYMLGLFFASFFTGWKFVFFVIGLSTVLIGILLLFRQKYGKAVFLAVFFVFAMGMYNLKNADYEKVTAFSGTEISFYGEIKNTDYYDNEKARYTLKGKINDKTDAELNLYADAFNCKTGDEISFKAEAEKMTSDYLFDSETYYKSSGIYLTVNNAENIQIVHNNSHKIKRMLMSYREKLLSDFTVKMGREGEFMSGMLFGEKGNLENTDKTMLYRCGIGHIMAVSGLHAAIMAGVIMYILKLLKVNRILSFFILALFLFVMINMVSSSISVIRASIMLLIVYSAKLFRRQSDTFNSLAIAVLFIGIINPFVIESSGFWLSVSGTFGIGVAAPHITETIPDKNYGYKFLKSVVSVICAGLAVVPAGLYYFEEISIISPISNLIIVPMCTLVLVIGFLYTLSGGLVSFLYPAKFIIKIILKLSDYLGNLKISVLSSSDKLFYISILLTVLIIFVCLIFKKRKYLIYSVVLSMVLFSISSVYIMKARENKFILAVLGSGYNSAICILHNGNADIIDLSGHYKSALYVEKYIKQNSVEKINNLIINKKQNSVLSTYYKELSRDIKNCFISSQLTFSENWGNISSEIYCCNESGFDITYDNYKIVYNNDKVIIYFGNLSILFAECSYSGEEYYDAAVFYGNFTKKCICYNNCKTAVYIDELDNKDVISGINNFEMELKSDKIRIRRL